MFSAHVDALKALLSPLGYSVYFGEAPVLPEYPYVVLWTQGQGFHGDVSVGFVRRDFRWRVGVTMTAGTPEGALIVQEAVRGVLMPGGESCRPRVAGRSVELVWRDGLGVTVDRAVKITGTDRFPAYTVDMYDLVSVPA